MTAFANVKPSIDTFRYSVERLSKTLGQCTDAVKRLILAVEIREGPGVPVLPRGTPRRSRSRCRWTRRERRILGISRDTSVRYGLYSATAERLHGHVLYFHHTGALCKVTCIDSDPTGPAYMWPDAVMVGRVEAHVHTSKTALPFSMEKRIEQ